MKSSRSGDQAEQGRGILEVVDGCSRKGAEDGAEIDWREHLVRQIGYGP